MCGDAIIKLRSQDSLNPLEGGHSDSRLWRVISFGVMLFIMQ